MKGISKKERSRSERELFNSIASKFIKKDIFPPTRLARKSRVNQTVSGIELSEDIDILDVGCGAGFASEYLSGKYKSYTGIDFSSGLIDLARSVNNGANIRFIETDLYNYNAERKFDLIIIIGVLHHMVDIPLTLKVCLGLLRPGGIVITNEPQDSNLLARFIRNLREKFDKTYSSDQEQLNRKELERYFLEAGYTDISVRPQGFFSSPFAELMIKPSIIFLPLSWIFCMVDRVIENVFGKVLKNFSWNIIVKGERPV